MSNLDKRHGNVDSLGKRRSDERARGSSNGLTLWSRRQFLKALGLGALSLGLPSDTESAEANQSTPKQSTKPVATPVEAKEVQKTREIVLGGVTFKMPRQHHLHEAQVDELFKNMRAAYDKLSGYFGAAIIQAVKPMSLEISVENWNDSDVDGCVNWTAQKIALESFNGEPEPSLQEEPSLDKFEIHTVDEAKIAHEFIHLFAQAPIFWSKAFAEGHAHAITSELYPDHKDDLDSDDFDVDIVLHDKVQKALDTGLDFNDYETSLNSGIDNEFLAMMLERRWADFWSQVLEQDPSFMRKFYREVNLLKQKGRFDLRKSELMEIAVKVSDEFKKLYEADGRVIDNVEFNIVKKAFLDRQKGTLLILNFAAVGQQTHQNGSTRLARVVPALRRGRILEVVSQDTVKRSRAVIPTDQAACVPLNLQASGLSMQNLQVFSEGEEVEIEFLN